MDILKNAAVKKLLNAVARASKTRPTTAQLIQVATATANAEVMSFFRTASVKDLTAVKNCVAGLVFGETPKAGAADDATVFGLSGKDKTIAGDKSKNLFAPEPAEPTTEEQKDIRERKKVEVKHPLTSDIAAAVAAVSEPLAIKADYPEILSRGEKNPVEKRGSKKTAGYAETEIARLLPVDEFGVNVQFRAGDKSTRWLFVDEELLDAVTAYGDELIFKESGKQAAKTTAARVIDLGKVTYQARNIISENYGTIGRIYSASEEAADNTLRPAEADAVAHKVVEAIDGLKVDFDAYMASGSKKTASAIDELRKIVEEHQMGKVSGQSVDAFSASAMVQVYDALKPETQVRADAMLSTPAGVKQFQGFAFKAMSGKNAAKKDSETPDFDAIEEVAEWLDRDSEKEVKKTAQTQPPAAADIDKYVSEFEDTRKNWSEIGADDTAVADVFWKSVLTALNGKWEGLPRDWNLYEGEDVSTAAKELSAILNKVVNRIKKLDDKELYTLKKWLVSEYGLMASKTVHSQVDPGSTIQFQSPVGDAMQLQVNEVAQDPEGKSVFIGTDPITGTEMAVTQENDNIEQILKLDMTAASKKTAAEEAPDWMIDAKSEDVIVRDYLEELESLKGQIEYAKEQITEADKEQEAQAGNESELSYLRSVKKEYESVIAENQKAIEEINQTLENIKNTASKKTAAKEYVIWGTPENSDDDTLLMEKYGGERITDRKVAENLKQMMEKGFKGTDGKQHRARNVRIQELDLSEPLDWGKEIGKAMSAKTAAEGFDAEDVGKIAKEIGQGLTKSELQDINQWRSDIELTTSALKLAHNRKRVAEKIKAVAANRK